MLYYRSLPFDDQGKTAKMSPHRQRHLISPAWPLASLPPTPLSLQLRKLCRQVRIRWFWNSLDEKNKLAMEMRQARAMPEVDDDHVIYIHDERWSWLWWQVDAEAYIGNHIKSPNPPPPCTPGCPGNSTIVSKSCLSKPKNIARTLAERPLFVALGVPRMPSTSVARIFLNFCVSFSVPNWLHVLKCRKTHIIIETACMKAHSNMNPTNTPQANLFKNRHRTKHMTTN